jgi:hypothetical protein
MFGRVPSGGVAPVLPTHGATGFLNRVSQVRFLPRARMHRVGSGTRWRTFASGARRTRTRGRPPVRRIFSFPYGGSKVWGPGDFVRPRDLSDLSTDPAVILKMMRRREIGGGPSGDWESFELFMDLLRSGYAPPAVRAAIFRAASMLDGVVSDGPMTDHLGRPGASPSR